MLLGHPALFEEPWPELEQWLVLGCLCVLSFVLGVFDWSSSSPTFWGPPWWHHSATHNHSVFWNCNFQPKLKMGEKPICETFFFNNIKVLFVQINLSFGTFILNFEIINWIYFILHIQSFEIINWIYLFFSLLIPFSHKYFLTTFFQQQLAKNSGCSHWHQWVWVHFLKKGK